MASAARSDTFSIWSFFPSFLFSSPFSFFFFPKLTGAGQPRQDRGSQDEGQKRKEKTGSAGSGTLPPLNLAARYQSVCLHVSCEGCPCRPSLSSLPVGGPNAISFAFSCHYHALLYTAYRVVHALLRKYQGRLALHEADTAQVVTASSSTSYSSVVTLYYYAACMIAIGSHCHLPACEERLT